MKNTVERIVKTMILLILLGCTVYAGGYQSNEQSARTTGMGGAFVARASDPSAIYFNPAGLGFQKGLDFTGGMSFSLPSIEFTGPAPSTAKTTTKWQVWKSFNFYGTYKASPEIVVGLGVYNPYGFGIEWPEQWISRQLVLKNRLQTWYFNPSIGYKINDELSLGAGVSYIYTTSYVSTNPLPPYYTYNMEYDMTGSGFNANFGVLYKPLEGLSIGVSYRLETRIKLESGGARLYGSGSPSGTWLEASYCRISMPMPANLLAGAAYEIIPGLTFEGDIQYVQWSTFKQLKIEIPAGLIDQEAVIYDKNWDDGYIGRLGLEYQFNDDLALRGGLVYDITPQPASTMEPMFPDADKIDATIGIGYRLDQLISVDVAYMLMYYYDRTSYSFPQGTYESIGHLIAVDVSFSF